MSNHQFPKELANQFDLCITWNNYGLRGTCAQWVKESGGAHFVMENSYLGRKDYITIEKDGHNGREDKSNNWEDEARWRKMGSSIHPWTQGGKYVLVCGQMGGNYSELSMPTTWPDEVVDQLLQVTDLPIKYRPHPKKVRVPHRTTGWELSDHHASVQEEIKDAACVVVYTSAVANIALLVGVPVIYCGPTLKAKDLCIQGVQDLDNLVRYDREPFFYELASTQWHRDEIKSGECWQHVL